MKKGNTKLLCFMIMHHHIQQNRSRKRLKRSVRKYFRTRLTHQTWFRPITIYLHRWDKLFLTSTSLLTKMYENGSMTGMPQKSDSFFGVTSTNCQTDGKMYSKRWAILRIKYFYSFSYNKRVFSIQKYRFYIYITGIVFRRNVECYVVLAYYHNVI